MGLEVINEIRNVKARKTHVCNWCGCTIPVGEIYQTQTLKYDDIYTWKNHIKCMEVAHELKMFDECDEGVTGADFYEYVTEEFRELWRKLDNEMYESKDFKIPEFKQQLEFVYKQRCGGV